MLAARLLDPSAGAIAADLCAAPGGKTGHLWELMGGRGKLWAAEVEPARRPMLEQALRRLHGSDPSIRILDRIDPAAADAAARCDRVLIDAPCQALGLIGRHPEIRWDRRLDRRDPVTRTQRRLLDIGARWVRPGGRLLWATCSPTRMENEELVEGWLADNFGWQL
ncbi:MAG: hypothetical protein R6V58_06765 [Planctomycetota bacterium]